MIPIVTIAEMREIDKQAIKGDVALGYKYMMQAAEGLYEAISSILPKKNFNDFAIADTIVILCGKGNNGGDGLALAKQLNQANYRVECFCLCLEEELQAEAKQAFQDYIKTNGSVEFITDSQRSKALEDYFTKNNVSLVIDAMLGSGSKGNPEGIYADTINFINKQNVKVLSVDVPSGFNSDEGQIANPCIEADITVTMGYPKIGMLFYPAKKYTGSLFIKELSYPETIVQELIKDSKLYLIKQEDFKTLLPKRKAAGSKFDHGLAFMLAGSAGMIGSAILASQAALRSGLGMVHLACDENLIANIANQSLETVFYPLNGSDKEQLDSCKERAAKCQVACIGPGVSRAESKMNLMQDLVRELDIPIVLDADGINAFVNRVDKLKEHKKDLLITPHGGEWKRLFGAMPEALHNKIATLRQKAKEFNMTILYKGSPTIVVEATNDQQVYILPYGSSALATAGSGDVLSGIITGLVAQGLALPKAAALGVYIHGNAGEKAANDLGEHSVIARDILSHISQVIKSLNQ